MYDGYPAKRFSWYVCHGCGWEAQIADGIRNHRNCGNLHCHTPNIHIHSDADGERPKIVAYPGPDWGSLPLRTAD